MIPISMALSPIAMAVSQLYSMGNKVNEYINEHIEGLKQSDNDIISSAGKVLEAAKYGFGIGYASSVAIIAVGQLLLGNTLAAVTTVATAAAVANPIAMTCAAIGAIYYGWNALSEKERQAIVDRLSVGLEMGVEIIKALIEFAIRKTSELLGSKQLVEFKRFISEQAAVFGRSLYQVTRQFGDAVKEAAEKVVEISDQTVEAAIGVSKKVAVGAGKAKNKVVETTTEAASNVRRRLK